MKHDNNTMWEGLLAIIRALILGRRLPPDQLRTFLLFAEPVPYLSAEQIAELLGEGCGHDLDPELPEGWTQGLGVNDPESGDAYDADAQILGEMLEDLLRKEHPEWEGKCWRYVTCDEGWSFMAYQVLDERRRVTPIACWFESKLKMLRNNELEPDEAHRRTVISRFIANTLEWVSENCAYEDEVDQLDEEDQEFCSRLNAFFERRGNPEFKEFYALLTACAEHIYDGGGWALDEWESPWMYAGLFWEALVALGYVDVDVNGHMPAKQQRGLFAA